MIRVTRINHTPLVVNADLIEHLEATPDTVLTLTTGQKLVVLETPEVVVERVLQFRRSICESAPVCVSSGAGPLGHGAPPAARRDAEENG
jgi:flagellar protein FlbD